MTPTAGSTRALATIDLPPSPLMGLPDEIWGRIMDLLRPEELAVAARVCRKFRALAMDDVLWAKMDLKQQYPGLDLFGKEFWEKHVDMAAHGISFGNVIMPPNKVIVRVLHKLSKCTEGGGVTVIALPNLTFNKLMAIASTPGSTLPIAAVWDRISATMGNRPLKPCVIAMGKSVVHGTRNQTRNKQREQLKTIGYEMPDIVAATAQGVLIHLRSPQQSFEGVTESRLWVYTHCEGRVNKLPIAVGLFTTTKHVINTPSEPNASSDTIGAAAVHRF